MCTTESVEERKESGEKRERERESVCVREREGERERERRERKGVNKGKRKKGASLSYKSVRRSVCVLTTLVCWWWEGTESTVVISMPGMRLLCSCIHPNESNNYVISLH